MRKFVYSLAAFLLIVSLLAPFAVIAEENEATYTITFTRGLVFIDYTLTGRENDHFFKGEVPEPIVVSGGESFVFPENTVTFNDYVFVEWKYSYKDSDNKSYTGEAQPGDVFENVSADMKVDAVWSRPDPIKLTINGWITFTKGIDLASGEDIAPYQVVYGSEIKMPSNPYTLDGYIFVAWIDSDGAMFKPGDIYTVNKINPVFTAVWNRDGDKTETHKISYKNENEGVKGSIPNPFFLYDETSFVIAACTLTREGYDFTGWTDASGKIFNAGDTYKISNSSPFEIVLTPTWRKIIIKHTVSFEVEGNGIVSPSGSFEIEDGESLSFAVSPNEGYEISSVTVNGINTDKYYIENITSDTNVKVVFSKIIIPEPSQVSDEVSYEKPESSEEEESNIFSEESAVESTEESSNSSNVENGNRYLVILLVLVVIIVIGAIVIRIKR